MNFPNDDEKQGNFATPALRKIYQNLKTAPHRGMAQLSIVTEKLQLSRTRKAVNENSLKISIMPFQNDEVENICSSLVREYLSRKVCMFRLRHSSKRAVMLGLAVPSRN